MSASILALVATAWGIAMGLSPTLQIRQMLHTRSSRARLARLPRRTRRRLPAVAQLRHLDRQLGADRIEHGRLRRGHDHDRRRHPPASPRDDRAGSLTHHLIPAPTSRRPRSIRPRRAAWRRHGRLAHGRTRGATTTGRPSPARTEMRAERGGARTTARGSGRHLGSGGRAATRGCRSRAPRGRTPRRNVRHTSRRITVARGRSIHTTVSAASHTRSRTAL